MKLKLLLILFIVFIGYHADAQDFEANSYIVTINQLDKVKAKMNTLTTDNRSADVAIRTLFKDANIYQITIANENEGFLSELLEQGLISSFSKNAKVSYRKIPNDSRYNELKNMEIIGAEQAWNNTTGGLTADGKEIVVAILDDGFDVMHPDLINNTWFNTSEIQNDGIDNDNNGYIDDYYGLNVDTGNDDHPILTHGTAVAGIIGAEGDNNLGVAGVNWNIKMMYVSQANFVDEIIQGYNYVYEQRKLYNETQGVKGAFVVSTNFSAGIDGASADSFPDWCNVYDQLGTVGIISVVATTNDNTDVDQVGDMPSTCPSPFMIAVTNTTQSDFFDNSGQGPISVDMAAPGTGTLTTDTQGDYDEFGGTSGATPHVAGSVALLYSINCTSLNEQINSDPQSAAVSIRDAILSGGDPLAELNGITVTGKRLNIVGAIEQLSSLCGGAPDGELAIITINGYEISPEGINLHYDTKVNGTHEIIIVDAIGRIVFADTFVPPLFGQKTYKINSEGLNAGTYFVSLLVNDQKVSKTLSIIR